MYKNLLITFTIAFSIFAVSFVFIVLADWQGPTETPFPEFLHEGSEPQTKIGPIRLGGLMASDSVTINPEGISEPTCDIGNRGILWVIRPVGERDELISCFNNENNNNVWNYLDSYQRSAGYEHSFSVTGGDYTYERTHGSINYMVHAFTTVGSHTLEVSGDLSPYVHLDVLVVGGGGGAGRYGGGGAGGLIMEFNIPIEAGSSIPITVGGGGTGVKVEDGTPGANSSFDSLIAYGGGNGSHNDPGVSGGSGGGGGQNGKAGGSGTSGQGQKGGTGGTVGTYATGGGGGGNNPHTASGSGGNGTTGTEGEGGQGGAGNYFGHLFGTGVGDSGWFAGGGGGAYYQCCSGGTGGNGGGGDGGAADVGGVNGMPNTGGGGGASNGDGGSGIVLVRYKI